eukprot:TRINITY_DN36828_c0_g1_i1.p1 TRINITY_DN36828_c0_g1~~TRINITY_DN36828_c0_g1_i1.p1  ORF type:complete len:741 (+),score=88.06 TRINITY_DN36828_c0_g1_i1:84-2306(+)
MPTADEATVLSTGEVAEVAKAAADFSKDWFPDASDPNAVQPFWFAARYARERKRFRALKQKYGHFFELVRGRLGPTPLGHIATALEPASRLDLCIFLDQQSRNLRALDLQHPQNQNQQPPKKGAKPPGGYSDDQKPTFSISEEDIAESTAFSAALAWALIASHGSGEHDLEQPCALMAAGVVKSLLTSCKEASVAKLCFLTLALRHTRTMRNVQFAQDMLEALDAKSPGFEVVAAFRRQNGAVLRRLQDLEYAERTAREGLPDILVSEAMCSARDANSLLPPTPVLVGPPAACLDPLCTSDTHCGCLLEWAREADSWERLANDPLVVELHEALSSRGLLDSSGMLILSYSGGVDSTAHLLMLLAVLRYRVPESARPTLRCLMLSYPNRDEEEVRGEMDWATWVCWVLRVQLACCPVRLTRPHNDDGDGSDGAIDAASTPAMELPGLSREEYERYTKEIRFRMYRVLLADCTGPCAVILGHHLDDIDENRLDHLLKGHVLGDVEGMKVWREILDVPLFRPLLRHRKHEFMAYLLSYPTPFFRDSTPVWSVRGRTRAALDAFPSASREPLLELLNRFGALAFEVSTQLDNAIGAWAKTAVRRVEVPRGTSRRSRRRSSDEVDARQDIEVLVLDLNCLFELEVGGVPVGDRLAEVANVVDAMVRRGWLWWRSWGYLGSCRAYRSLVIQKRISWVRAPPPWHPHEGSGGALRAQAPQLQHRQSMCSDECGTTLETADCCTKMKK